MSNSEAHTELIEIAALYALGALSQDEARSFEDHLRDGCDICTTEVQAYGDVIAALSFGVKEESPSPEVKQRLQSRLNEKEGSDGHERANIRVSSQILSVRADEGGWHELEEGIHVKQLFVDNKTGMVTALVKMSPGTHLPRHRHIETEQLYILEGDCHVQGEVLGPGDFHCATPGSVHDTTFTIGGTLFLHVGPERYEVLQ
ncbi:MAG TPA: cupin domain-containing protein [Blastocatellia bacterium]|nr:cupin domain-containing protein [Blastocatellia bacterium]